MAAIPDTARATDLYERFAPRIFGYCLHRLGSREEAEDAVQTTFLNAFRGLSRGVVPESEAAWLFKIAENVCLSRHRASFRRRRVEAPGDLQALEASLPARERPADELIPLPDALAEMPETQRRALMLREWQGLSYREIAAELEVSQSAVETLIFRARRTLARRLEAPREQLRRLGQALDIGFLAAAAKAAVATVAVTGVAVGVTGERPSPRTPSPPPAVVRAAKPPVAHAPVLRRQVVVPSHRRSAVKAQVPPRKPAGVTHRPVRRPTRAPVPKARPVAVAAPAPAPALTADPAPSAPVSEPSRPEHPAKPQRMEKPHPQPATRGHSAAAPKAKPKEQKPAPPPDPGGQGKAKGKTK